MTRSTYVATTNEEWAAARAVARHGDAIVVTTWEPPRGRRGIRYTVDRLAPDGLTGPTRVYRLPGVTTWME